VTGGTARRRSRRGTGWRHPGDDFTVDQFGGLVDDDFPRRTPGRLRLRGGQIDRHGRTTDESLLSSVDHGRLRLAGPSRELSHQRDGDDSCSAAAGFDMPTAP
jgi:hypothetical protein